MDSMKTLMRVRGMARVGGCCSSRGQILKIAKVGTKGQAFHVITPARNLESDLDR